MILVLTPLALEHEALTRALGQPTRTWSLTAAPPVELNAFDPGEEILCAVGGHGKVQFALTTQYLLRELKPRLAVCAGTCGALSPHLKALDLVAATETVEHDYTLRFAQRPPPRFYGDVTTLRHLSTRSNLHHGVMASGDEDVVTRERASELHSRTGAIAVAWEGAGFARACRFHGTPFVELRCVTDTADHRAAEDFRANVTAGMSAIAEIVKSLAGR